MTLNKLLMFESSQLAHPFLSTSFVEKVKSDMTTIYIQILKLGYTKLIIQCIYKYVG
jgi:hypothetical protein